MDTCEAPPFLLITNLKVIINLVNPGEKEIITITQQLLNAIGEKDFQEYR